MLILAFSAVIYSQQTIYDKVVDIKSNPTAYTAVIGRNAGAEEIKYASELIGALGMRRASFDTQVSSNTNLIVIGLINNNEKVAENINRPVLAGMIVKVTNNNLIVTAPNLRDLRKAIDILKDYEANKEKLLKDELTSSGFFAPVRRVFSSIIFVYIIVGLLIIGGSTLVVVHAKKNPAKQKPEPEGPVTIQSPTYIKLKNYVAGKLKMGYNEAQIRAELSQEGWKKRLLDAVFNEVRKF